jgi:chromosome segregation ATPase
MHATDALYGVVMNRDGMSKVLSVKLEDIKQHGEDVSIDKKA